MSECPAKIDKFSTYNHQSAKSFTCIHCGAPIPTRAPGTRHRNHCPHCLWSRHVDGFSGDRKSICRQPMKPIAVTVNPEGEWSLIHRCSACGYIRLNRIAGDDNEFQLLAIAAKPLTLPPFPVEIGD